MAFVKGSQTTLLVGVLVALVVGFLIGNASSNFGGKKPVETKKEADLFENTSATFKGKIDSVSGKILSVSNEKGVSGEIELADNVVINKLAGSVNTRQAATSSTELKSIETGKPVTIYLQNIDGKYKVLNISYTPADPIQSLPPVPVR